MGVEYLTRDELDRLERLHVKRATWLTLLVGAAAFLPLLGFVFVRPDILARVLPPGSFGTALMATTAALVVTGLAIVLLVRSTVRSSLRSSRQSHQQAFERRRAATLARLFSKTSST